jgi:hypothetical protein
LDMFDISDICDINRRSRDGSELYTSSRTIATVSFVVLLTVCMICIRSASETEMRQNNVSPKKKLFSIL